MPEGIMDSQQITDFGHEAQAGSGAQNYAKYNSGAPQVAGLMNQPDNYSQKLGGADNAQLNAIKSKYDQKFGQDQSRLNLTLMKQANEDHLRKVQIANQMANQEMEINRQKEMLRQQRKAAKRQARGAMIGNVLGIVGAVGGGLAGGLGTGGTPMGAIAGASVGNSLGQAAGGAIGGGL